MNVSKGRNFIVVGLQAFDSPIGSNCINIAREIARDNNVLYVNYPLDFKTYLGSAHNKKDVKIRKEVLKNEKEELEKINGNLWVLNPRTLLGSINWVPDGAVYDFLNKRNNYLFAKRIRLALNQLGFEDYFIFNDSDMFRSFYLKELLKPEAYIYYSRDNLVSQPYFKKHGERLEARLIAKSDLATANSLYLKDYCKKFNTHSYYVGQGCETELFDPNTTYSKPDDLPQTDKPIIGYIGALLKARLDIDLLEKLARENEQWEFVFVGPEDDAFKKSKLHQISNVTFTGSKKPTELPQYLSFFDVAINPQAHNPLTIGNYPRKIDEYLAMGKPSVATKTRAMDVFKDHVYLAETQDDYQSLIERALEENNEARVNERVAFAGLHTWKESVKLIYKSLERVMVEKKMGKD